MNQLNSQIQASDSTNLSPPLNTIYSNSQDNNTLAVSSLGSDVNHGTSAPQIYLF
jgi:hypothetical protein